MTFDKLLGGCRISCCCPWVSMNGHLEAQYTCVIRSTGHDSWLTCAPETSASKNTDDAQASWKPWSSSRSQIISLILCQSIIGQMEHVQMPKIGRSSSVRVDLNLSLAPRSSPGLGPIFGIGIGIGIGLNLGFRLNVSLRFKFGVFRRNLKLNSHTNITIRPMQRHT